MSPTPQLKVQGGWFAAAGAPLLQAMESVSDGAFKTLCLSVPESGSLHRRTDRLAYPVGSGLAQISPLPVHLPGRTPVPRSSSAQPRSQSTRAHSHPDQRGLLALPKIPRPGARSGRIPIPRSGGLSAARCPWRSVLLLPGRSAAGRSPLPPGPVLAADRAGPASRLRPQARRLAQRPHRWTDHFPELLRTSNPGSETTTCLRSILGLSQESPEDSEATMETTLC